jgi:Domain of unknown function (DUF2382)/PRC-barrel domain
MAPHDLDTVLAWRGATVIDRDGEKIGTLKELYLDQDDRPAWAAVETGLFGLRQSFVPLEGATALDDQVRVPFDRDHVKDAPNVDPDAQLTEDEEARLEEHYRLERGDAAPVDAARPEDPDDDDDARREGGEARADDAMTRSEEELVVGTRRRVRGKARLKKYVVTEHVQRTIPVQREEVRIEYEPEEGAAEQEGDPPAER